MKNQILSEEFSRMQKLAGIQLVENRQSEAKKLFSEWSQDINTFEEFASFLKEEGFDEEQRINFIIEILNSLILIPNQISEKFDLQQKIKNFNEIKVTNPNPFKISLQDYIEKFMPDITYEDVEEYGVKNFNDFFEFLKDYGYEPLDILIQLGDNYLNPKPLERKDYDITIPAFYTKTAQEKINQYIKNGSKGNLDLNNTPITSLPDNLKVGGSLVLTNTPIISLPDNLQVGGDLYLAKTKITSLPDDLQVGGSLGLILTPITSLPDDLQVGRDLYLHYTSLTSLPDNIKVGGDLYLKNTPISKKYTKEEIKRMVPGVKGEIKV